MDPINLLLCAVLWGGGFWVGRSAGRKHRLNEQNALLQTWKTEVAQEQATTRDRCKLAVVDVQRNVSRVTARVDDLDARLEAVEGRKAATPESVDAAMGQLKQLEQFAETAAGEIAGLRQRLMAQPPAPAPFWGGTPPLVQGNAVMAQGMPAMPERTAAEAQALTQAVVDAQAEFARRQRADLAASFRQPPGGQ